MLRFRSRTRTCFSVHTRYASGATPNKEYDCIVVGGGHNGLVSAAYLSKARKKVLVLEKRHIVGGAAITEELYPSFKYSRGSYVFSLFRPTIVKELELKKYGLKLYKRDPSSFTPLLNGKYLLLGGGTNANKAEISKFSKIDAENYEKYEHQLQRLVKVLNPYLDAPPPELNPRASGFWAQIPVLLNFGKEIAKLGRDVTALYELFTAPASKILHRWFESEPLKATLATDAVVGAMTSPQSQGSGYVLFHHIMGEVDGQSGSWAYVEGGMGKVSQCIADCALKHGAEIRCNAGVSEILTNSTGHAIGVRLDNGENIYSKQVISNASPHTTFLHLLKSSHHLLPAETLKHLKSVDVKSPVCKINVALDRLPNFTCRPNEADNQPGSHHQCTIHMGCETMEDIHQAYVDAMIHNIPSHKPIIEMTIPSVLDPTLAPHGKHVASLFCQYIPYSPEGKEWTHEMRQSFAKRIFAMIDEYAPGFSSSVLHADILTPPDLERVFGLTAGNISHISMSLDQLFWQRPAPGCSNYITPIHNLYICGAGTHPGGGVIGASGKNAAFAALRK